MHRLQFRSADGSTTFFDDQRVLRVGRGKDNDILLDSPSVSRNHAELRPTDIGWDLHDSGSTAGTWVDNQRVMHLPLGATTTVRFGGENDGVEATITIDRAEAAADEAPDDQKTMVLSDQQRTVIYQTGHQWAGRPTGGLLVRTRDGDKRVEADKSARIGRDVRSDIVADDPAVSRHHATLERRADGWWFVDHSNSGSYVDGERVKEKKITEETVVQLGHPAAGYQVTLVPVVDVASAQKAIAGKRRRRRMIQLGAAAAVVVVVAAGVTAAVLLTGGKSEQNKLSAANLERAKRASVQIIARDDDGLPLWSGSGSIISADGLILTNAHVAKPTAKGLAGADSEEDAAVYEVALAKDDNTPAQAKYRATTIVADGYLDLAVMKINANADGSALDGGKLALPAPMPIGDSNALQTGDQITTLGYPGLTSDQHTAGPLTVTTGDVSAFKRDYATNTERFWIDTTARIAHGNSGGASINSGGEMIAVNTRFQKGSDNEPAASFLIRPIALAADIIKIARNGGDPNYVSPYLDKIQKLPAGAKVTSSGWDKTKSNDCGPTRDPDEYNHLSGVGDGDTIYAKFRLSGIPNDTPITIVFKDSPKNILGRSEGIWFYGESPKCISPGLKLKSGLTQVIAILVVGYQDELKVTNAVKFD